MATLVERIKKSWNVFIGREPAPVNSYGFSMASRPDRAKLTRGNERSIINSIYNRIAIDVASVDIRHVRLDENGRYLETIDSGLNNCLTVSANIDQTGRAFIQDAVLSMFDEGVVALVPIDTNVNPNTSAFDVETIRTGKIVQWYPERVRVSLYNELTGKRQEVTVRKDTIAIIENPFYSIMNEPNSTLQRLIRILNNIDRTNEKNAAGKLDLIIQLPYLVKSETKKQQAEERRKQIETQLTGSQYGIAYIDGTEHITQLGRSIENNLWEQAKDLTDQLFNQLGLPKSVFDGTADEKALLDYYTRTIEPILVAITEEMKRKFLSKTARTQHQSIKYFREPFKLVPVNDIADIADKFTRNEILSSNEIRAILGFKPDNSPKSDQLINSNMPMEDQGYAAPQETDENGNPIPMEGEEEVDPDLDAALSELEKLIEDM